MTHAPTRKPLPPSTRCTLAGALLGLAGCGTQASEQYVGESLLHLEGEVVFTSEATPKDLKPALAFHTVESEDDSAARLVGYRIMDVAVRGEFPASFTLDVFEPPPLDVYVAGSELQSEDGRTVRFTTASITAVADDHPELVLPAELYDSARTCMPYSGECALQHRWCNAHEECYQTLSICPASESALEGCESERIGDPAALDLESSEGTPPEWSTHQDISCDDDGCVIEEAICRHDTCFGYRHTCSQVIDLEELPDSPSPGAQPPATLTSDDDEPGMAPPAPAKPEGEPPAAPLNGAALQSLAENCERITERGDVEEQLDVSSYFAGVAPYLTVFYLSGDLGSHPAAPEWVPTTQGYHLIRQVPPSAESIEAYGQCLEQASHRARERYTQQTADTGDEIEPGAEATLDELVEDEATGCVVPEFAFEEVQPGEKLTLPIGNTGMDAVGLSLF